MLTFHGGFSLEQVEKLKNGELEIFSKISDEKIYIPRKNTFDYYPSNISFNNEDEKWKYIANDIFIKQYIFLFKYLYNAFEFCHNTQKRNYILVADIDENILNEYIGVGRYINNQVEYRIPRCFVTVDKIIDFLYFEPYDEDQMEKFKEQYPNNYYSPTENKEANEILLKKSLTFNEYKNRV